MVIERALVVPVGDTPDAVAATLTMLGLRAEVVGAPVEARGVDAAHLRSHGLHVDPRWVDESTGRTLTKGEAARTIAHAAAWGEVASGVEPVLVAEAGAKLADEVVGALGEVRHAMGDRWDVLHLDAGREGLAYGLTPHGALALLSRLAAGVVPLSEVLASAEVDAFVVSPPVAGLDEASPRSADPVLTDHLVVVSVSPDHDVAAAAVAAASEAPAGTVVLVVPEGRSRVSGTIPDVLAAYARLGAPVVAVPDRIVIGPAAVLAGGIPNGAAAEAPGLHVHLANSTEVVALGGRARDARAGVDAWVVTADHEAALEALDRELADPGQRDLVALLRYEGAAATGEGTRPAPEILELPFWTPGFCRMVLRAAEATGAFAPHEDDPVPGHEVSLAAISPRLYAHLEDDLAVRVLPLLREVWPYVEYHGLRDAFVIKYAPGLQEELRVHHDVAQLSASVKLNDGYEGAVLEFPRQGWSNADVPVGHLVVWPSLVTHPHLATPLTAGVKYGLTIWFELPGA